MRRRGARVATAGFALLVPLALAGAASAGVTGTMTAAEISAVTTTAGAPATIPALRSWTPGGTGFALGAKPSVVTTPADAAALATTAGILAEDLTAVTGREVDVAVGVPKPGDIELDLAPITSSAGAEGYLLQSGPALKVTASTGTGVFNGTRSVAQLLRQDTTIVGGTALDWPRYPERGFLIDLGRRFLGVEFLRAQIREMSYLKLNLLHLHLSEDLGFRIKSDRHPEITSAQHLTKAEVSDLVAYAAERHITVVPEIDMPGHMGAILAQHPEHQLANMFGIKNATRLDITSPAARAFALDIIDEFLPLFPGKYWHIGGDEYMPAPEWLLHPQVTSYAWSKWGLFANGKDAYIGFLNSVDDFLNSRGKVSRVWNDELGGASAVRLHSDIVVEWWTDFSPKSGDPLPKPPQHHLDRGHRVQNSGWWPTYDAMAGLPAVSMAEAYDSWKVHEFFGALFLNSTIQTPPHLVASNEQKNLGAKLSLWMDGRPEDTTDAQLAASVLPRLQVIAQKTWESPPPGDYARFTQIATAIGTAP